MTETGVLSVSFTVKKMVCRTCHHTWPSRKEQVLQCPRCRKNLSNDGRPVEVTLAKVECPKCSHKWAPRTNKIKECPNCKIPLINKKENG